MLWFGMTAAPAPQFLTRTVRPTHRNARGPAFLGDLSLAHARAHELCGPARRTLALMVARALDGPVFWIAPAWGTDRLYPPAMRRWIDPGRVVFFDPKRPEDILWAMEETLRTGLVPLVVADLPSPPGMTPVRRLHLAAETGAKASAPPLALVLTPGTGGAPGIESRWALAPMHGAENRTAWRLDRRRARTLPPAAWMVTVEGAHLTATPTTSEPHTTS
ncbi:MAG: hypothetical protein AAGK37_01955 [Pseudomonadota bacterium]